MESKMFVVVVVNKGGQLSVVVQKAKCLGAAGLLVEEITDCEVVAVLERAEIFKKYPLTQQEWFGKLVG